MSKDKSRVAAGVFELSMARNGDELDAIWQRYESVNDPGSELVVAYHKRAGELEQKLFAEGLKVEEPRPKQRRELWEERIQEIRAQIKEEETAAEAAKILAKTHKQNVKKLALLLNEVLESGSENFELDDTPLLTYLAQNEAQAET